MFLQFHEINFSFYSLPVSYTHLEVTCATQQVHIFGEVTTTAKVDYEVITRNVINEIGYTAFNHGFDATKCQIQVDLHEQSPDIALGIHRSIQEENLDNGAGEDVYKRQNLWCQI